jgi:hypothetical protein
LLALMAAGGASARHHAVPPVRLSTDNLATPAAQHATQVEPAAATFGSMVVTAFQVGRFFDGASAAIGFATSTNAGRTWRSGLLPGVTSSSPAPGPAVRATDAAVAYDSVHRRWLVESLTLSADSSAIVVSGSVDGLTWDAPVTAISARSRGGEDTNIDKSWIACDNGPASPLRGRCYIAYTDFTGPGVSFALQSSTDGGRTWSTPVLVGVSTDVPGVQPVVRPNGELVVVFLDGPGRLEAVRSTDGGASFGVRREIVARTKTHARRLRPELLRVFPLPSAAVDSAGTVFVAWSACGFRPKCRANDIVVSHSTARGWTLPRRVPVPGATPNADHVLPALGVDPRTRGTRAHLGLTFYSLRDAACAPARCMLDARMTTSATAGSHWSRPVRLNARGMPLSWLPRTNSGTMVGDYFATPFAAGRAISVFALARRPVDGRLDEAIHAVVRPVR